MAAPTYEGSTRSEADLANTAGIFRDARDTSTASTLAQNSTGLDQAKGLLGQGDALQSSLGGQPNPMGDAIKSKYMRTYNQGQQHLNTQMKMDAQTQYFNKLSRAKQAVGEEQEMNYQKALMKYKQDQAKKAARAGLVGSVLGIVGAVGGGMAGGAGGAMAGNAAGNAAGNIIGGD